MPLRWTIDSTLKTVEVVAEGDVTVTDAMAFFDAIEAATALSYNKLLDGTHGRAAMNGEELMAVVARIRDQHGLSAMGALAIVASPEQTHPLAAAVADRPLKIFDELRPARRWLAGLPARA